MAYCRRELNFIPEVPWPLALPPICWKNWLIAGFDSKKNKALRLSEPCFHKAFWSCYRNLSLPELARFYGLCQELTIDWAIFFKCYGFRDCENFRLVLNLLTQTPKDFQSWCSRRQLGPKDLAILRSLDCVSPIAPLLLSISRIDPSKSLGSRILYLGCELYLMGHGMEELTRKRDENPQQWCEFLQGLRTPQAHQRDQNLKKSLKNLPWPSGSEVRSVRNGDLSGFEIKFQIHSQQGFKKYLQGLQHTCEVLEQKEDYLW